MDGDESGNEERCGSVGIAHGWARALQEEQNLEIIREVVGYHLAGGNAQRQGDCVPRPVHARSCEVAVWHMHWSGLPYPFYDLCMHVLKCLLALKSLLLDHLR